MTSDLVSILIPAYNHEQYIEECIRSALTQTYKNVELVIINDGSTDKTADIIGKMKDTCEERFERFAFIDRENKGTAATCRELLDKANGKYVIFISSDDALKDNSVDHLYSFMSKNPDYALVVGDNEIIDEKSQRVFWDRKRQSGTSEDHVYKTFLEYLKAKKPDIDFHSSQFGTYETLLKGNYIPNGFFLNKSILDKVDAYNPTAPLEDWYFMLQMSKAGKMKCLNNIYYSYRWHASNAVKNKKIVNQNAQKIMMLEIKNVLPQTHTPHSLKLHDFLKNNKKKTMLKFGNWLHIYRIRNVVLEKYVFSLLNADFTWVKSYNPKFKEYRTALLNR